MANELNIGANLFFQKNGAQTQRSLNAVLDVVGSRYIQSVVSIGTSDETLDFGDVATAGYLLLKNLAAAVKVVTPTAPVITPMVTVGAVTWSYVVVAKQSDGSYSAASAAGTTTTGVATLSGTGYNKIDWVADTNATGGYDIYRTAHGTSPNTNGLIASVAAGVTELLDQGLAGDGATPPVAGTDNVILFGSNGTSYPNRLKGTGFSAVCWNGAAIHAKANTVACDLEYVLIED